MLYVFDWIEISKRVTSILRCFKISLRAILSLKETNQHFRLQVCENNLHRGHKISKYSRGICWLFFYQKIRIGNGIIIHRNKGLTVVLISIQFTQISKILVFEILRSRGREQRRRRRGRMQKKLREEERKGK